MKTRKYPLNENYFKHWSSSMAYTLGFITADGYVRPGVLEISLNPKDVSVLEYIRDEISPTSPIKDKKVYLKKYNKTYYQKRLTIFSQILTKDLMSLGVIPKKTGKETLPDNMPIEFLGDYIRGLFDGDGNVYSSRTHPMFCSLCSASKSFLVKLQELCGFGSVRKSNNIWNWTIPSYQCGRLKSFIYKCEEFCLKRKKDKIIRFKISDLKCKRFDNWENLYIKECYINNIPVSQIASHLGRNRTTICGQATKLGVSKQKRSVWTDIEKEYVITNFNKNNPSQSCQDIGKVLNKTVSAIQHFVSRNHLCGLRRRKKKNGNS